MSRAVSSSDSVETAAAEPVLHAEDLEEVELEVAQVALVVAHLVAPCRLRASRENSYSSVTSGYYLRVAPGKESAGSEPRRCVVAGRRRACVARHAPSARSVRDGGSAVECQDTANGTRRRRRGCGPATRACAGCSSRGSGRSRRTRRARSRSPGSRGRRRSAAAPGARAATAAGERPFGWRGPGTGAASVGGQRGVEVAAVGVHRLDGLHELWRLHGAEDDPAHAAGDRARDVLGGRCASSISRITARSGSPRRSWLSCPRGSSAASITTTSGRSRSHNRTPTDGFSAAPTQRSPGVRWTSADRPSRTSGMRSMSATPTAPVAWTPVGAGWCSVASRSS